MEFGYPGANTHLENHGVSEESFWPSFTDIMMVIVMVFLLVTVAVILNNWSLIGDLKNSIQAQQIASNLAENTQQENDSLGSKLSSLEKQIIALNEKYEQEKASLATSREALESNQQALSKSQQALSENQQQLADKADSLSALEEKLVTLDESLTAEKASHTEAQNKLKESEQKLAKQENALTTLQTNFDTAFEQKNKLALLNKAQNSTIAENEKEQQALQQALNSSKSTIESLEKKQATNEKEVLKLTEADALKAKVLASLQTDRSDLEKKVSLLQTDYSKAQKAAAAEIALSKEAQENSKEIQEKSKALQTMFDDLKKSQQEQKATLQAATDSEKMTEDALQVAQDSLKELEEEKQRIILSMSTKLTDSEKKISSLEASVTEITKQSEEKDAKILAFNENDGNDKLRSLQGEYDTLDAKYQKLLRPARSSKGKYIVSISYKKRSGKRVIRLKSGPDASYKTVTKSELHKSLLALKMKHKTDLYLKIIIPKTSGLSYSEAWKFTSNLQRKYDYYHQPDAKK